MKNNSWVIRQLNWLKRQMFPLTLALLFTGFYTGIYGYGVCYWSGETAESLQTKPDLAPIRFMLLVMGLGTALMSAYSLTDAVRDTVAKKKRDDRKRKS